MVVRDRPCMWEESNMIGKVCGTPPPVVSNMKTSEALACHPFPLKAKAGLAPCHWSGDCRPH